MQQLIEHYYYYQPGWYRLVIAPTERQLQPRLVTNDDLWLTPRSPVLLDHVNIAEADATVRDVDVQEAGLGLGRQFILKRFDCETCSLGCVAKEGCL